jgi:hypothetical protein
MDTYQLQLKGFSYIGSYSLDLTKLNRYASLCSIAEFQMNLCDKQYCYVDSADMRNIVLAKLKYYGTVRANQLSHDSYLIAWSKAKPKVRPERVLYTDVDGREHNLS